MSNQQNKNTIDNLWDSFSLHSFSVTFKYRGKQCAKETNHGGCHKM
jgi:hypothetical protein